MRDTKRIQRIRAAGLGQHEEHEVPASPAPTLSSEQLAQQLAQDPEFQAWAGAERTAQWFSRGTR